MNLKKFVDLRDALNNMASCIERFPFSLNKNIFPDVESTRQFFSFWEESHGKLEEDRVFSEAAVLLSNALKISGTHCRVVETSWPGMSGLIINVNDPAAISAVNEMLETASGLYRSRRQLCYDRLEECERLGVDPSVDPLRFNSRDTWPSLDITNFCRADRIGFVRDELVALLDNNGIAHTLNLKILIIIADGEGVKKGGDGGRPKSPLREAVEYLYNFALDKGDRDILEPGNIHGFMELMRASLVCSKKEYLEYVGNRIKQVKEVQNNLLNEPQRWKITVKETDSHPELKGKTQKDVSKLLTNIRKQKSFCP